MRPNGRWELGRDTVSQWTGTQNGQRHNNKHGREKREKVKMLAMSRESRKLLSRCAHTLQGKQGPSCGYVGRGSQARKHLNIEKKL